MKLAHKFNWHYAPPVYPEGDTQLWCQWCGFRETIKGIKYNPSKTDHIHRGVKNNCVEGCPLICKGKNCGQLVYKNGECLDCAISNDKNKIQL